MAVPAENPAEAAEFEPASMVLSGHFKSASTLKSDQIPDILTLPILDRYRTEKPEASGQAQEDSVPPDEPVLFGFPPVPEQSAVEEPNVSAAQSVPGPSSFTAEQIRPESVSAVKQTGKAAEAEQTKASKNPLKTDMSFDKGLTPELLAQSATESSSAASSAETVLELPEPKAEISGSVSGSDLNHAICSEPDPSPKAEEIPLRPGLSPDKNQTPALPAEPALASSAVFSAGIMSPEQKNCPDEPIEDNPDRDLNQAKKPEPHFFSEDAGERSELYVMTQTLREPSVSPAKPVRIPSAAENSLPKKAGPDQPAENANKAFDDTNRIRRDLTAILRLAFKNLPEAEEQNKQLFEDVPKDLQPLSPEQAVQFRKELDRRAQAAKGPPPTKLVSRAETFQVSPTLISPTVTVTSGVVTALVFTSPSGQPWQVNSNALGNGEMFHAETPDKSKRRVLVSILSYGGRSSISVARKGIDIPVNIRVGTVCSHTPEQTADGLVNFRIENSLRPAQDQDNSVTVAEGQKTCYDLLAGIEPAEGAILSADPGGFSVYEILPVSSMVMGFDGQTFKVFLPQVFEGRSDEKNS
jgi:hypothetical protein